MEIVNAAPASAAAALKSEMAVLANEARTLGSGEHAMGVAGQALPPGFSFAQSMKDALASVNEQDQAAGRKMNDVDSGKSDDLVGAMLASQQASLSFSMLMQVRNKVMGAVDDLLKLPV